MSLWEDKYFGILVRDLNILFEKVTRGWSLACFFYDLVILL